MSRMYDPAQLKAAPLLDRSELATTRTLDGRMDPMHLPPEAQA